MNALRYRATLGDTTVEFDSPIGDGFALDEGAALLRMAGALPDAGHPVSTRLDTSVIGLGSWEDHCRGHRPGRVFSRCGLFSPTDFLLEVIS